MNPIDEITLAQVASDVCETMLGMSLSPAIHSAGENQRMVASVQISGDTVSNLEIETVHEVACRIACRMFSMEATELDESDFGDALGEVANMIGGNVKGILCGEFDLSLPTIEFREVPGVSRADAVTVWASCEGFPFTVRLAPMPCPAITS